MEFPASCREVAENGAFMLAAGAAAVVAPLEERCCEGCEGCEGCEVDWGCGLGLGAVAVAGGVEMPFCMDSATGEAMVDWARCAVRWRGGCVAGVRLRSCELRGRARALRLCVGLKVWGERTSRLVW